MLKDIGLRHTFRNTCAAITCGLTFIAGLSSASADEIRPIALNAGHSLILQTPHLTRVGVGDKMIAGVVPIGNSEVLVNGKSSGSTTVFAWMGQKRVTYDVTVTDQAMDNFVRMLRASIVGPNVTVSSFNRSVVLKGTVDSTDQFLNVDDVLSRFGKVADANKLTLVNAVTVVKPMGELSSQIARISGASSIEVERDGKGNLIVSGRATNRGIAENVLGAVRMHAGTALAFDGKIIDRIALDTTTQVDVKVYILEIDNTAASQLGLRLQSGTPDPTHPGTLVLGTPSFPILEQAQGIGKAVTAGAFYRNVVLAPTLDLILNNGHARILSSPDLVTLPGREANFLVGGEIPIPFASGPGQIAIEYKQYGVQLKMTPTILGNGNIETVITPEVSDLDFADAVNVSGFTIPALKTSRISTDVVTASGESIVMGGLMRRLETKNVNKIPLLGDIPILGQLFRSTSYQKADTDVVFVMTPQVLVR
jgi:pilus assembly protein CpaC